MTTTKTMELSVQGHGVVVTKKLEHHIRTKAERLARYLPGAEALRVEVAKLASKRNAPAPKRVQLTVHRKHTFVRAEETNGDPYIAFDAALDKLLGRVAKYKGRKRTQRQIGIPEEDADLALATDLPMDVLDAIAESGDGDDVDRKVVRTKSFVIVPMHVEEAVEQMELVGHDFYVFMHEDDGKIKVVYRRKNGDYGLLQPES